MFRRQKWWYNPSNEHRNLYMKRFQFISPPLGNGPAFRGGFFSPHWQVLVGYVWSEDCDWRRTAYVTAASRRTPLRTKTRYIKACHKYRRKIQLQSRASARAAVREISGNSPKHSLKALIQRPDYCVNICDIARSWEESAGCLCVKLCDLVYSISAGH